MKQEEKISIFKEIGKKNFGLFTDISKAIGISNRTLTNIVNTGIGTTENKNKILNYLIKNNYIREGEYTITEFFNV